MTAQNPALYIQGANHPAEDFRHLITTGFGGREGVVRGGLAVTERSGTANMSVDVAEGTVAIAGTETTYQGLYLCHNRGVANLAISASDPTNDRYDLILAQVEDAQYSGATNAWKLSVVTGTPAASPLFPTVPDNAFVLATVLVPAAASAIVNADITDIRDGSDTDGTTTLTNRGFAANPGVVVCTSSTRPSSPYVGMEIFETNTDRLFLWDGADWSLLAGPSPFAIVRRTSDQTIPANVETNVSFDTDDRDSDSFWVAGDPTVLTIPISGVYHVVGQVTWQSNATGYRYAGLKVNGTWMTIQSSNATVSLRHYQNFSMTWPFNAGDEITVSVRHNVGGGLNIENSGPTNRIAIHWVSN